MSAHTLRSKSVRKREIAQLLLQHQDPLLVAEAARKAPGANWDRSVKASLYEGITELDPSALHVAAAGHLLAGDRDDTTLVTLNFDTLLESALRDETSERVESRIDGEKSDAAYAVHHLHGVVSPDVLLARQGFELSREQFQQVETALADQWRSAGLEPIVVEDFADAAQIVRELRHVHLGSYSAPQVRARAIWDAHATDFESRQRLYSEQLLADSALLSDALDVDQLNVTLWLADAEGRIARWAAQDRLYRSSNDLRLVDSGHDSPWVAGRALGLESILFEDLDKRGTQRWRTVLAVPIRVEHSGLPEFASAVLTVGLPGAAKEYEPSTALWLNKITTIANEWSTRLDDALA